MSDDYSDIIDLPHPISVNHPPMPMINRAAQFAPFAALTGYDDAIEETARLTDGKTELDEDSKYALNEKLMLLRSVLSQRPEITLVYFQPDEKKDGGEYLTKTGIVKKVDDYTHTMLMEDGTLVQIDQLMELEGKLFSILE